MALLYLSWPARKCPVIHLLTIRLGQQHPVVSFLIEASPQIVAWLSVASRLMDAELDKLPVQQVQPPSHTPITSQQIMHWVFHSDSVQLAVTVLQLLLTHSSQRSADLTVHNATPADAVRCKLSGCQRLLSMARAILKVSVLTLMLFAKKKYLMLRPTSQMSSLKTTEPAMYNQLLPHAAIIISSDRIQMPPISLVPPISGTHLAITVISILWPDLTHHYLLSWVGSVAVELFSAQVATTTSYKITQATLSVKTVSCWPTIVGLVTTQLNALSTPS